MSNVVKYPVGGFPISGSGNYVFYIFTPGGSHNKTSDGLVIGGQALRFLGTGGVVAGGFAQYIPYSFKPTGGIAINGTTQSTIQFYSFTPLFGGAVISGILKIYNTGYVAYEVSKSCASLIISYAPRSVRVGR